MHLLLCIVLNDKLLFTLHSLNPPGSKKLEQWEWGRVENFLYEWWGKS